MIFKLWQSPKDQQWNWHTQGIDLPEAVTEGIYMAADRLAVGYSIQTLAQGAGRETLEESGADVTILEPYGLFNLTFVGQVYIMFLEFSWYNNFLI